VVGGSGSTTHCSEAPVIVSLRNRSKDLHARFSDLVHNGLGQGVMRCRRTMTAT
jgi:hypothetical protein